MVFNLSLHMEMQNFQMLLILLLGLYAVRQKVGNYVIWLVPGSTERGWGPVDRALDWGPDQIMSESWFCIIDMCFWFPNPYEPQFSLLKTRDNTNKLVDCNESKLK